MNEIYKKKWLQILKTIFHVISVGIFYCVLLYGGIQLKMFLGYDEKDWDPDLVAHKPFVAAYLTNWNYRKFFNIISSCAFYFVFGCALALRFSLTEEDFKNPYFGVIRDYAGCMVTNWNLLFQTTFLTMSLVYDIMEWLDKHESSLARKLKYYRDIMFSGLVLPLTLFVSKIFWTLFWINRELVYPEIYDQLVPWWFNHCVHTNIIIVLLLETLLQARRHPTNMKVELCVNATCGIAYAVVHYSIYFFANRWLYAVFSIMTWWQVCLCQLLIWASTFVFYFIQFPINRLFHSEEPEEEKTIPEHKNGETETGISKSWSSQEGTKVENSSL